MKKAISFSIILAFLLIFLTGCTANNSAEDRTEYLVSSIIVMIKKEYSEFGKEYYPSDFDEDLIKSVRVMNQINPGDDTSGYDLEYWQQTLELELKEPSYENVQKAIEAAYANPEVELACSADETMQTN